MSTETCDWKRVPNVVYEGGRTRRAEPWLRALCATERGAERKTQTGGDAPRNHESTKRMCRTISVSWAGVRSHAGRIGRCLTPRALTLKAEEEAFAVVLARVVRFLRF